MLALCSLQSLFRKQIGDTSSDFDKLVSSFLATPVPLPSEIVEDCVWKEPLFSEDVVIENWKQLLALNILCELSQTHQAEVTAKVRSFERHPWNRSSQYLRALIALNHAFAKMPVPEVGAHLLESGAALIDLREYCPWLSLPYHPHHLEFGLFLCLLTFITKRQDMQEIVLQLAHWQLNMLDASAKPFRGLFVREKEGKAFQHLCLNYLFFRSVALLCGGTPFAAVSEAALKDICESLADKRNEVNPLWPLIEKWLEKFKEMPGISLVLPEQIYDASTALVGFRSSTQHVVCTLHGGHTGLGILKHGGVEIVNFGPQYLPLEECQGFGIEGNALSDQGMRRSLIEWRPHAFSLKGCARLVDQPSTSPFGIGKFRGIWMDITQEYKKPHFYLKTSFLGLDGWDSIAFSFFVKAERCRTYSQEVLLPQTLERYEGTAQTLTFESQESILELRPLTFKGMMQVIPLAGGNNFWGADFLVAYFLSSDQRHYQWHAGPPLSNGDRLAIASEK